MHFLTSHNQFEMSPEEARRLARQLIDQAKQVEQHRKLRPGAYSRFHVDTYMPAEGLTRTFRIRIGEY